jgi:hypothetical protein
MTYAPKNKEEEATLDWAKILRELAGQNQNENEQLEDALARLAKYERKLLRFSVVCFLAGFVFLGIAEVLK